MKKLRKMLIPCLNIIDQRQKYPHLFIKCVVQVSLGFSSHLKALVMFTSATVA